MFSGTWGVTAERFERYLVDWGLTKILLEDFKVMSPTYKKRREKAYRERSTDGHGWLLFTGA